MYRLFEQNQNYNSLNIRGIKFKEKLCQVPLERIKTGLKYM